MEKYHVILYIVQVHKDISQIIRLISLLDDEENSFLVNVDPSSYNDMKGMEIYFPAALRRRLHIRRGLPVTWGGFSQIVSWLDAYRYALECITEWNFVVLMSGACIPFASQTVIKTRILAENEKGIRVHHCNWGWKISHSDMRMLQYAHISEKEFSYSRISLFDRVDAHIEKDLVNFVTDRDQSPVYHAHRRGDVFCNDQLHEKKLTIRSLLPHEVERRTYLMSRFPVSGGWMWSTFRKDALIDLMEDPNLHEITEMISTFICSDELFIPTILNSSSRISEDEISRCNFYFADGCPHDLTIDHLDQIRSSNALFGRKIDYRKNKELILAIEDMIYS